MSIENPTLAHFRHFSSLLANLPSTSVENPLQINSFMQNKANLPDDQMNVTTFITKDYENKIAFGLRKNKPNTKPNKANLPDDQMNVTIYITKEYENKSNWTLGENKAKTKPIQSQYKAKQSQFPRPKPRRFDCCLALDLSAFCFPHDSLNFRSYCRSSCDIGFDAKQFLEKHTQYDWLKGYLKDLPSPEPFYLLRKGSNLMLARLQYPWSSAHI